MHVRIETYRWYAQGYRYPIFETINTCNIVNNAETNYFSTAFFYPPDEHYYLTSDCENQATLDSLDISEAELGAAPPGIEVNDDIDPENYTEEVLDYDKMGNIRRMKRDGLYKNETFFTSNKMVAKRIKYGNVDNLTFTYTGNQLQKISDASKIDVLVPNSFDFKQTKILDEDQYTYDANGRTTRIIINKYTS